MLKLDTEVLQKLGQERAEEVLEDLNKYFDEVTIQAPVHDSIKMTGMMFRVEIGGEILFMSRDIDENEVRPL